MRIFISYSRTDEKFARKLATDLSDAGADIWMDVEDIPPGMNWSSVIQEGLDLCDVMLLIVSPAAMVSKNVGNEWQYYFDKDKQIIPIRWLPSQIHFQLSRIQYVDFHEKPYEIALEQLFGRLGLRLPTTRSPNSPPLSTRSTLPLSPLRRLMAGGIAGLVTIGLIVALVILLSGGDKNHKQNQTDEQGQTQTSLGLTDTPTKTPASTTREAAANDTDIASPSLDIHPTNTPNQQPSQTPTSTPTNTSTATASMTSTFTNSALPSEPLSTQTDTAVPTSSATQAIVVECPSQFGVEMAFIPSATFLMGNNIGPNNERPQREITVNGFCMDIHEVTNGEYQGCVNAGICSEPSRTNSALLSNYYQERGEFPVVWVSWQQANQFCTYRGEQEDTIGRLPTEAEWELAASYNPENLHEPRLFPWGDLIPDGNVHANFSLSQIGDPIAVGQREGGANAFGVQDLSGNVAEWVNDWYTDGYNPVETNNPMGVPTEVSGQGHVVRGGSYRDDTIAIRAAYRSNSAVPQGYIGFRCVIEIEK
ncbi:MAG: SUMF1/EgtB/PvdO family nonheme iron enzyme [Chloroflexi bacterium]|nr:SUMF1/EgtB/PvdO family nonheme iron enzyme [Chloroflexota bacterium]